LDPRIKVCRANEDLETKFFGNGCDYVFDVKKLQNEMLMCALSLAVARNASNAN